VHQPSFPPLVSVIVPLYNADKFVLAALTSILQEKTIPLEVIVVNDGSTDRSVKKIRQIRDRRLRIIHNPGKGIASALNAGFSVAQGEFVVRCDADDLYPAHRIAQQVHWLKQHPEFGAVCGGYAAIDCVGLPVIQFNQNTTAEEITQELRAGVTRTHFCTFAVRRDIVNDVGGCRPYFITAEDIDLQLRIGDRCKVWYEPGVHYFYRLHNSSITHRISSVEREFFDAIARTFQHQRYSSGKDDIQRGCPPSPPSGNRSALSAAHHIQNLLLGQAWQEHDHGDRIHSLMSGLRSVMVAPENLTAWRSLLALVIR